MTNLIRSNPGTILICDETLPDSVKTQEEGLELGNYHVNPSTSMAVYCSFPEECPVGVPHNQHYVDGEAANRAKEGAAAALMFQEQIPSSFEKSLLAAADGGFVQASEAYPTHLQAQLDLLLDPIAVEHIAHKLCVSSGEKKRNQYAAVLAWVVNTESERTGEGMKKVFRRLVEPHLKTKQALLRAQAALSLNEQPSVSELLYASGSLWIYRLSPYHNRAKLLLFADPQPADGYTPRDEKITQRIPNSSVAKKMKVDLEDLPEGTWGYDIETDTSLGYGLRPHRGQITEVVLSSRDESFVFAGDEKHILEEFATKLNSLPAGDIIVGWNNRCFDNIALQTRAELHGIKNWGGRLVSAPNHTMFSSVGPLNDPQKLVWTTTAGDELQEEDVFQMKSMYDSSQGQRYTRGLKPFVENLGCNPITVDRSMLHNLTDEERIAYVLSDGIATLRALTGVRELFEQSGIETNENEDVL